MSFCRTETLRMRFTSHAQPLSVVRASLCPWYSTGASDAWKHTLLAKIWVVVHSTLDCPEVLPWPVWLHVLTLHPWCIETYYHLRVWLIFPAVPSSATDSEHLSCWTYSIAWKGIQYRDLHDVYYIRSTPWTLDSLFVNGSSSRCTCHWY